MGKAKTSEGVRAHDNEIAAEWVELDKLSPWADNPRKNDKAVPKVAASIKRFGFGAPLLARKADGQIIAGHTRYAAAQQLGLTKVPVRFLDLDPADAHLLALADNKIGEVAEWDEQAVAEILNAYGQEDVALAGWDSAELDKLAGALDPGEIPEPGDDRYSEQFGVIVVCTDAADQERAYNHLQELGYNCKVVVT